MEGICKPAIDPQNPVRDEDVCFLLPAVVT
jgi:hypothetical protein